MLHCCKHVTAQTNLYSLVSSLLWKKGTEVLFEHDVNNVQLTPSSPQADGFWRSHQLYPVKATVERHESRNSTQTCTLDMQPSDYSVIRLHLHGRFIT